MVQRVMAQAAYEALLHNLGECWSMGKRATPRPRVFTYDSLLTFFVRP